MPATHVACHSWIDGAVGALYERYARQRCAPRRSGGGSPALRTLADFIRERGLVSESPSPALRTWITELNRRTTAYHPAVRAVVGVAAGTPELVVTAEGDPAGAEPVRSLVAAGPPLPGWTVRAFKPALSAEHCVLRVGAVTLRADEVEFAIIDIEHPDFGKKTLLLLFVPGLVGPLSAQVRIAAEKLLEAVAGEESWLRWSGSVVMEDRDRPAAKVAAIPRHPLDRIATALESE